MMKKICQWEPWFGDEEKEELIKTIESTWIAEGSRTKRFEKVFAEYVGAKYAVTVNNGTVSLAVALMAVGVSHGDEVLVPDFTFIGTANAVNLAGGTPVLVDVRKEDLNIDPEQIEESLTIKTRAIIPVHINGRATDICLLYTS